MIEKLKGVPQLLAASKRAKRRAGIDTALEVVTKEGMCMCLCVYVYGGIYEVLKVLLLILRSFIGFLGLTYVSSA